MIVPRTMGCVAEWCADSHMAGGWPCRLATLDLLQVLAGPGADVVRPTSRACAGAVCCVPPAACHCCHCCQASERGRALRAQCVSIVFEWLACFPSAIDSISSICASWGVGHDRLILPCMHNDCMLGVRHPASPADMHCTPCGRSMLLLL